MANMRSIFASTAAVALATTAMAFSLEIVPMKPGAPTQIIMLSNPLRRERLRAYGEMRSGRYSRKSSTGERKLKRERAKYLRKSEKELAFYS